MGVSTSGDKEVEGHSAVAPADETVGERQSGLGEDSRISFLEERSGEGVERTGQLTAHGLSISQDRSDVDSGELRGGRAAIAGCVQVAQAWRRPQGASRKHLDEQARKSSGAGSQRNRLAQWWPVRRKGIGGSAKAPEWTAPIRFAGPARTLRPWRSDARHGGGSRREAVHLR